MPHPIRVTMYILTEGLKMLRTVAAQIGAATVGDTRVEASLALLPASRLGANLNAGLGADREGYARSMYLYRGMKDMEMDIDEFKNVGGVELAPMSTTRCVMSVGVHCAYGQHAWHLLSHRNSRIAKRAIAVVATHDRTAFVRTSRHVSEP